MWIGAVFLAEVVEYCIVVEPKAHPYRFKLISPSSNCFNVSFSPSFEGPGERRLDVFSFVTDATR
jgi:hypothetical protein